MIGVLPKAHIENLPHSYNKCVHILLYIFINNNETWKTKVIKLWVTYYYKYYEPGMLYIQSDSYIEKLTIIIIL